MNEIQRQVSKARRRINLGLFFRSLIIAMTAGLAIGSVAFAVPRIWVLDWTQSVEQIQLWQIGWATGAIGLALLSAIIYSICRPVAHKAAAIEVDLRFQLKERVSSTLAMSAEDAATPAGRSLTLDAQERVARIDVRDAFPFHPSRNAFLPLIPAAIMVALLFVPTAKPKVPTTTTQTALEKKEIEVAIEQAKKALEEKVKILSEKGLEKAAEDLKNLGRELDQLNPEDQDLKKEALVKLNDLKEQLDSEKNKLGNVDELKKEFGRLKEVAPGPGKEIADAMKEGDFEKAKNAVKELAEKIKEGKLTEAEQKKLAENLNDLARAVDEMAAKHEQQKQDLEEQIKQAQQNNDPQKAAELQEKLEQKKAQDKQIQKMKDMANNLKECANCMKKQGQGKPQNGDKEGKGQPQPNGDKGEKGDQTGKGDQQSQKEAQQALEDIVDQLEQMQNDQDAMDALDDLEQDLQDAKDNMNQIPGGENDKKDKGDWAKGKGRGHGKRALEETETGEFKSRVKASLQKGQTIVAGEADGDNSSTGSIIDARNLVKSSLEKDSDPIEDQLLPKAQREQARQYFEKLRKGK